METKVKDIKMIEAQKKQFWVKETPDKDLPLVSVIMPVYNAEKYLKNAIWSVLSQKYKKVELICINDGSTDNSLNILRHIAAADERVKIIDQKNSGPAHARNVGLDAATGKYISFVDADDCTDEWMYYSLVEYAETEDADIIVFGGIPAPNQEKAPQWIWERMSPRFIVYDGKNAGAEALFKEKSSTPFLWLHFIKRELFEKPTKLRLHEDLDLGEDQVFQFMYFPRAEKLIFWDKQYYYYRWDNEGSLMWKYNHMPTEKFRKHLKIVETVFQEWEKAKYKDPYGRLVSWMVNFLYDDWKAFPAYLQSEFAGQIVDMAEKGDQSLYMSDEYQIDRAKEIEQKAKNADGGEKETEEQILLLKASISAIEGEIQELIHCKSFRLGKMLTPKKKRLDMQSILPPERKKN